MVTWISENKGMTVCMPHRKTEMKHFLLIIHCIIGSILLKIHSTNWRSCGVSRLDITTEPYFFQPSTLMLPVSFILINKISFYFIEAYGGRAVPIYSLCSSKISSISWCSAAPGVIGAAGQAYRSGSIIDFIFYELYLKHGIIERQSLLYFRTHFYRRKR